MIPIKIQCECGQPYAFEIEPENGKMPVAIACPTCGRDGTAAANEVIARSLAASPQVAPADAQVMSSASPQPSVAQPEGFVNLDFVRTFPHVFWVSSLTADDRGPDRFRYKVLTMRREPEMMVDIILLREAVDGKKTLVSAKRGSLSTFGIVDGITQELGRNKGVTFERLDFSNIRSLGEFRARAIECGWEAYCAQ